MPAHVSTPCKADPEMWFSGVESVQAQAATVCLNECPMVDACARRGMAEEWGVWGGMTPADPMRAAAITRMKRERISAERAALAAEILALTADGESKASIASKLGVSVSMISRIRAAA